jgi:hypothetical protein
MGEESVTAPATLGADLMGLLNEAGVAAVAGEAASASGPEGAGGPMSINRAAWNVVVKSPEESTVGNSTSSW